MYFGQALIAQAQPISGFEKLGQKVPSGHFLDSFPKPHTTLLTYVELHATMPDSSKDEYLFLVKGIFREDSNRSHEVICRPTRYPKHAHEERHTMSTSTYVIRIVWHRAPSLTTHFGLWEVQKVSQHFWIHTLLGARPHFPTHLNDSVVNFTRVSKVRAFSFSTIYICFCLFGLFHLL